MWKIRIVYSDKSKCTLTGKHKDIPLDLARHYYKQYVRNKCKATYQQYPKKLYEEIDLFQKIEELEACEEDLDESYRPER